MNTLLWAILVTNYLFLLIIGSVRLNRYEMSGYSLRQKLSDETTAKARQLRRFHKLLPKIKLLQKVELVLAGIVSVVIIVSLTNSVKAILITILAFTFLKVISRLKLVQKYAHDLFESTLDIILVTVEKLNLVWFLLGVPIREKSFLPSSQDDLLDQISNLPSSVLSSSQKQRLISLVDIDQKVVRDMMTLKKRVVSVKPSAVLGPVVLSDLQKSGHGFFPVVDKDAEPEGILDISKVADIQHAKQQNAVRDIMSKQLIWVEEDTSLEELIQAFLQEKQYLLLVRNLNGDFTGVVTIADLMKQLVGIVKE